MDPHNKNKNSTPPKPKPKTGKISNHGCCSSSILYIAWSRDINDDSSLYRIPLGACISIDRSC